MGYRKNIGRAKEKGVTSGIMYPTKTILMKTLGPKRVDCND